MQALTVTITSTYFTAAVTTHLTNQCRRTTCTGKQWTLFFCVCIFTYVLYVPKQGAPGVTGMIGSQGVNGSRVSILYLPMHSGQWIDD
jgi:hypothetical protein